MFTERLVLRISAPAEWSHFALVIGLVGGFFPARQAAKLPVVQALR